MSASLSPLPLQIVQAFKRNCPHVRMTIDEEAELIRLIQVMADAIRKESNT